MSWAVLGDSGPSGSPRRPRVTNLNKKNVDLVWGKNHMKEIKIPSIIDDYNHWMLVVDKIDQYITYYQPQLRVQRYWMEIFFHCLDILRVHAYLVYHNMTTNDNNNLNKLTHKMFICEFISALLGRAASKIHGKTRKAGAKSGPLTSPISKKRRINQNHPELPPERLNGNRGEHVIAMDPERKQRACRYCSFLRDTDKINGKRKLHVVRNVMRICVACNVNLCNAHFDKYPYKYGNGCL